jgi:hypothetical protein
MGLGQMSKLEIKYVSLDEVRPYAGNARTHSKNRSGKLRIRLSDIVPNRNHFSSAIRLCPPICICHVGQDNDRNRGEAHGS